MAAIRGEPVDRVPLAFWLHDFAAEHSAAALAESTLARFRRLDWDFLKPQSRATCFAEMWGTRIEPSTSRTEIYTVREFAVPDAGGLGRLQPADASQGALAEQLEAYLAVRAAVGPDVPILATIFSPLMATRLMVPGARDAVLQYMRDDPAGLERGLAAIGETLRQHARRCIDAGIDGIFFAESYATKPLMTEVETRRFQRQFDLPILEAIQDAPMNIVHVCGDNTRFDDFLDYPVSIFSWATTPGNPRLSEVRDRTGRAVLGGLPGRPLIELTPAALTECVRQALRETGGRHHLLGPGCSLHPGTPNELLAVVGDAVRSGNHV